MKKYTRGALLISSGDPFVLLHTLSYFPVWKNEVDALYICINTDLELSVVTELIDTIREKFGSKVIVKYVDHCLSFGRPVNELLEVAHEDNLLLLEDDAIIFKKGIVDKYFTLLEKKGLKLIGSPRMSCAAGVAEKLQEEFGLDYSGFGDKGPAFWPNFLWVNKMLLEKTDKNFAPTEVGDTFVWMSIQLRRLLFPTQIIEIPQYHCSPDDPANYELKRGIFDGDCKYMHFGSLSAGIENTLLDDRGVPLKERTKKHPPTQIVKPTSELETIELEKRVIWWREAYELNKGKFGDFGVQYEQAIHRVIRECKLDYLRMDQYKKLWMGVIRNETN